MTQNTKTCTYCGTVNFAHAQFCATCGQPLPEAVATPTNHCEYCGNPKDPTAAFCAYCGAVSGAVYAAQPVPKKSGSSKVWIVATALIVAICLLISALFNFVINPALEESGSRRDRDNDSSYVDDGDDNGNTGGSTTNRSTTNRTTTGHAGVQPQMNAPSMSQIQSVLTAAGYSVQRQYDEEGIGAELMSGVSYDYCYYATRYFDENGNLSSYDQDFGYEGVQIRYVVFNSTREAENAYREMLAENIFDGAYQQLSGNGYDRAWQLASAYGSEFGIHMVVSRIGNVIVGMNINWDDFKDFGLYYDNAAYTAMMGLGF